MLNNFWYACEFSHAVTHQPKQIVLWQQTIVLYRNTTGQVVALKDRCPHRGAALSLGKVEGDCLRCPYHGWKFQSDGTCNEIPANPPGVAIHPQAGVQSYPVEEKYGFIWLFWGDLPSDERPSIPSLPEFPDSSYRAVTVELEFQSHYSRLLENTADPIHPFFVHGNTFLRGDNNNPQFLTQGKLIWKDWGVSSIATIQEAALSPKKLVCKNEESSSFSTIQKTSLKEWFWRYMASKKSSKTKMICGFYLPNLAWSKVDFKFGIFLYIAYVPIDERTTKVKLIFFRNFATHPWLDRWFRKFNLQVMQEDKVMVESQRPQVVPDDINAELHAAGDAIAIAYRRLRQKGLALGFKSKATTTGIPDAASNGN
ncbi:MAG: aromatic ring-hydroxylating dioxygenase subunit alpha [Cyanosarcina radialis HA8281-LM2]|jgi:phenylpropionate dioxygenase-like ring-hydroxylating dioxygenase large terminal subunit|nr:aromatic ring-hydroxylating dioxygenase subunit alpha [Cyanosarcina radialis HA8281-LM2]